MDASSVLLPFLDGRGRPSYAGLRPKSRVTMDTVKKIRLDLADTRLQGDVLYEHSY
jgi:hypothetical protein